MTRKIQPRFLKPARRVHEVDATYLSQVNLLYQGNPLIEALPASIGEDEWILRLNKTPEFSPEYARLSDIDRFNELENVKRFYQPLDIPLRLAIDFDIMLRSGYVDRSPVSPVYRRKLQVLRDHFDVEQLEMDEFDDDGVTTSGITVMGLSGVGKTRTLNRILARYPQKINHSFYDGQHLTFGQVTYLKFDCPPRGTLLELTVSFFYALDRLFKDTDYLNRYMRSRITQPELLARMLTLATEHYLGALILDEVGNLLGAKEGRTLLNYLIMLSNDFKIPIILVGTPKAEHILTKSFSQMRRGYGYDEYNRWLHMRKDSDDWEVFVKSLWRYQYLQNFTVLTVALQNGLHDICGGIADLAVKMFIAAQKRAIRNKMERLTVGLLKDVAREEFGWATTAVAALRLGTQQALLAYEDLYFRHMRHTPVPPKAPIPTTETSPQQFAPPNLTEVNSNAASKSAKSSKPVSRRKPKGPIGVLAKVVEDGRPGLSAYQSLLTAGWIGSVESYL